MARALVSTYAEDDTGAVAFTVQLMPDALSAGLAAAAAAREKAVRFPVQEMATRRRLARQLYVEGLEVADIAAALGVSSRRVQLLLSERDGLPVPAEAALPLASVPAPRRPRQPGPRGDRASAQRPSAIGAASLQSADLAPPSFHRFRHEALLYRSDEGFLEGTLPFVRQGLDLGHAVMVTVPEPRLTRVREALGSRAKDVTLVDMRRLGANPARIIPAWQQLLDEQGRHGRPVRGVAEPLWPGRRPVERAECDLHETLLNLAFAPGTPLWLRCAYGVEHLGDAEIRLRRAAPPGARRGRRALPRSPPPRERVRRRGPRHRPARPAGHRRGAALRERERPRRAPTGDSLRGRGRPRAGAHRRPDAGRVGAGRQQRPARRW